MTDRVLRLTERIEYMPVDLNSSCSTVTVFPGLVSEHFLRMDAGDDLVDRALRLGVLVDDSVMITVKEGG